jgi:hypothetical protein
MQSAVITATTLATAATPAALAAKPAAAVAAAAEPAAAAADLAADDGAAACACAAPEPQCHAPVYTCAERVEWCLQGCGANVHADCIARWQRVAAERALGAAAADADGTWVHRAPWVCATTGGTGGCSPGLAAAARTADGWLDLSALQPGTSRVQRVVPPQEQAAAGCRGTRVVSCKCTAPGAGQGHRPQ